MCGILGTYELEKGFKVEEPAFSKALLTMHHRGPDAQQFKELGDSCILGHLRLSIIDLSDDANQPFQYDDRYWLVFNGEIFNYLEIKQELESEGVSFNTQSDTEVLLKSYIQWGESCVSRFNGMWAFAIYDQESNKLFCSRDRFGIKPFNYATCQGQFVFSSEIKAILSLFPDLRKPNLKVIANYCRKSIGAQLRESWFESIFRLEPAHNLVVEAGEIKTYRYWNYPTEIKKDLTFEEATVQYQGLLESACQLRMRSDVPVGFTLSSGIDSGSLVSLLRGTFGGNTNTYTASFKNSKYNDKEQKQYFKKQNEIDEPSLVRRLTDELGLQSSMVEIDYEDYTKKLQKLIFHLESGHGSPAIYPLYQVLERASKDVTVVLEGQGADELLAGYISNAFFEYFFELLKKGKIKTALKELKSFTGTYSIKSSLALFVRQSNLNRIKSLYYRFSGMRSLLSPELRKYRELSDSEYTDSKKASGLKRYLLEAHTGGLVNLLHYGDAISMAHSLESRLPFMDYRLVEFVFGLPSEHKIQMGLGKFIHRKSMETIVPDFILNNPLKFGFDSPLAHIFGSDEEGSPKSILLSDRCLGRGLFEKEKVRELFTKQQEGIADNSRLLYRLLSVELWFREFIDQPVNW